MVFQVFPCSKLSDQLSGLIFRILRKISALIPHTLLWLCLSWQWFYLYEYDTSECWNSSLRSHDPWCFALLQRISCWYFCGCSCWWSCLHCLCRVNCFRENNFCISCFFLSACFCLATCIWWIFNCFICLSFIYFPLQCISGSRCIFFFLRFFSCLSLNLKYTHCFSLFFYCKCFCISFDFCRPSVSLLSHHPTVCFPSCSDTSDVCFTLHINLAHLWLLSYFLFLFIFLSTILSGTCGLSISCITVFISFFISSSFLILLSLWSPYCSSCSSSAQSFPVDAPYLQEFCRVCSVFLLPFLSFCNEGLWEQLLHQPSLSFCLSFCMFMSCCLSCLLSFTSYISLLLSFHAHCFLSLAPFWLYLSKSKFKSRYKFPLTLTLISGIPGVVFLLYFSPCSVTTIFLHLRNPFVFSSFLRAL